MLQIVRAPDFETAIRLPSAHQYGKRRVRDRTGTGLLTERRLFQLLTATEDQKEGMAASVEKRPATWEGR